MESIIAGLVKAFQKERELEHLPESEAFETFAAYCVLSSFYEDEFSPDSFRSGGGNDLGIDAYAVLVNGELLRDAADVQAAVSAAKMLDVRVIIIQAKTTSGFKAEVVPDLADNLHHVLSPEELQYPASDDVHNLRDCMKAIYENIGKLAGGLPKVHVRYVTTGSKVADYIKRKARSAVRRLREMNRFDLVEFQCLTERDLRGLYQHAVAGVSETVHIPKNVFLPKLPGVRQALMGLLSAKELVDTVLDDHSGRLRRALFNDNVRDFLGYNEVKSQMRATLRAPDRRETFAVLNNGITIVARDMAVVGEDILLKDFQIVNGCQTCHVLFQNRELLTDSVEVSVRIVHSQDEDLIHKIIGAANRQTAITEEDLAALEDFHKRLEDYFALSEDKQHKLYYERRAKQYSEDTKVEKTRIITRDQLSRAYLSMFLNEPARVGHFKELLESRGKELYVDGQPLVPYYTAAMTLYRLEWLIRNRRIKKDFRPAQYHLLAAAKIRLAGTGSVPRTEKAAERECEKILKVMWEPALAEKLFVDLLRPLQRAIDEEQRTASMPLREMVRNQRFAHRVRQEVLAKPGR